MSRGELKTTQMREVILIWPSGTEFTRVIYAWSHEGGGIQENRIFY